MNVTDGEFFLYKNRDRCEKGYMLLREIAHFRTQKRKYCIYGLLQERRLSSKAEKKTRNEKSISQNIAD